MEFRNAQRNAFGTIDCEINHPIYGWIPTTASANDAETASLFVTLELDDATLPAPPPSTDAEARAAWRANAVISQAQARLTLLQLGLLTAVQDIADADPAASIVWEYADEIRRASPFIDGLGKAKFTPEQIDDIFRYAMDLKI